MFFLVKSKNWQKKVKKCCLLASCFTATLKVTKVCPDLVFVLYNNHTVLTLFIISLALEALGKVTVTIFLTTQMKLFRYSSPNQLKSKELSLITTTAHLSLFYREVPLNDLLGKTINYYYYFTILRQGFLTSIEGRKRIRGN